MLPSTGYFKTINCPFYESGTCDRPYCHFKHAKREDVGGTGCAVGTTEARPTGTTQETKTSVVAASDSEVLQQLVTEAVKKVLADREVTDTENFSENVVSRVVEGLKPTLASGSSASMEGITQNTMAKRVEIPAPVAKPVPCVYNPTPIAELKKRHIPIVSYMPTRESRVAVKRKSSPDGVKSWLGGGHDCADSRTNEVRYKPTTIVNANERDTVQSYVPTCKSDSSSSNSYEDSNSNDYLLKLREGYYPKSKKRREEYVPKKVKTPLKSVGQLDESALDQFEPEFDMIDEILTAARSAQTVSRVAPSDESQDSCLDLEPKFSDDEPTEDAMGASVQTDEPSPATKTGCSRYSDEKENENAPLRNIDITSSLAEDGERADETEIAQFRDESKSGGSVAKSASSDTVDEINAKKTILNDESKIRSESKGSRTRNKDGGKGKEEKRRSSTDRNSKEKHRRASSTDGRKRSEPRGRDKDENRDRRGSRDSRSRKDQRELGRKEKKDQRKSEKRRSHDSKSRSSSSARRKEHSSKSHGIERRSRSSRKVEGESTEKSNKSEDNSEGRNSFDEGRSNSPFESVRSIGYDDYVDVDGHNDREDEIFNVSDSDHDVQEECLKIFQEYQVSERPKAASPKEWSKPETEQVEEIGRKRVAHPLAASNVSRQHSSGQPTKKFANPQQKMYERWRLMREAAAEKAAEKIVEPAMQPSSSTFKNVRVEPSTTLSNNESQFNGNGRVRIAHVPYARSLAMEKRKVAVNTGGKVAEGKTIDNKTTAQTAKSGVRVAHVPQVVPQLVRPEPLQVTTQKFPLNVRQYYVNIMHDVCVQIYTNAEDAAQRAVKEEFACHERCKALAVYKNSCMLAAHRLRKEVDQNGPAESSAASGSGMVSHEALLTGKSKGTWSVLRTKKCVTDFKGTALYGMLKKWIMTEQQLRDNGFPRPHPDGQKGRAKVYVTNSRNRTTLSKVPNERMCSRCGMTYMIDKHGFAVQQQNCIYHWGRKFTIRGESKYSCCQQYGSATGCCDAKTHVWDYTDYENLRGYVKTLPKDIPVEEQGVYALDCEMCYTTQGLELTRITVIDEDCNVMYESLVKPQNTIIDYNTRFSGITEENMKDVTTTLLDVQAALLTMFSDKTVLVGHSLESDFKALRLLHDTVVDTSVMFPHKNGYPQKRALKNLCSEYLRKLIQNDVGGHDSKEDAVACMELILWKAKEEAKLQ